MCFHLNIIRWIVKFKKVYVYLCIEFIFCYFRYGVAKWNLIYKWQQQQKNVVTFIHM